MEKHDRKQTSSPVMEDDAEASESSLQALHEQPIVQKQGSATVIPTEGIDNTVEVKELQLQEPQSQEHTRYGPNI